MIAQSEKRSAWDQLLIAIEPANTKSLPLEEIIRPGRTSRLLDATRETAGVRIEHIAGDRAFFEIKQTIEAIKANRHAEYQEVGMGGASLLLGRFENPERFVLWHRAPGKGQFMLRSDCRTTWQAFAFEAGYWLREAAKNSVEIAAETASLRIFG